MNALLLSLFLSASDVPLVDVEHGTLTDKTGAVVHVSGGVWIEDKLLIERATQLQQLADENARLKSAPTPSQQNVALPVVLAFVVGATVGALVALAIR